MRALTSLTTMLTLALGLVACGDDKSNTTPTTMPTTDPTAATDVSAGTTTTAGTTTGDPTTSTSPTTTGDDASGTTTDPSDGTTTDPSDGTTTDPSGTTTDPSGGTTTDPSGGTSTGGPGEDLYGPCDAMGMCPADQLCLMVGMIDGNFCAPDCIDMMKCPDVPAGVTAQPQCVLTKPMEDMPTSCALICDPKMMDMCPEGMTCKPVPMQTVGLCTAP